MRPSEWWAGLSPAVKATWGAGALAAVATLVGAVIETGGGDGPASGTSAPTATVSVPALTAPTTTPMTTATSSPVSDPPLLPELSTPPPEESDSPATPETVLLADVERVDDDNNFGGVKAVKISGELYSRSPGLGCLTSKPLAVEWNTAGYSHFTALLGIADSDGEGSRINIHVSFQDHDGQTLKSDVVVSSGHPARIAFPLKNATRLHVECLAEDKSGAASGRHVTLRLGQATLSTR